MREEAIARDHNKIGREMNLFLTSAVVGQGLPIMTPRGAKIERILPTLGRRYRRSVGI